MSKYSTNEYVKIFDKLPPEIKDVVSSSTTTDHLVNIGKKHNLQIDQIGALNSITLDVMMGIVATKNFVTEVVNELKITPLEASSLIRDVDEEMLKPIKKILIDLYADGAPNRPSSSLVQYYEEDENHPSLDKDAILSEIEKPVESPVKKEIVAQTVSKLVSEQVSKEISKQIPTNQLTSSPTNKLDIYHEELEKSGSNEVPKQASSNQLTNLQPNNLAASDLLNKIAGMKLSKTFVMPKGDEVGKVVSELGSKGNSESVSKEVGLSGGKETPSNLTDSQANQLPKIDPYREKI